jgi:hypothetical protein
MNINTNKVKLGFCVLQEVKLVAKYSRKLNPVQNRYANKEKTSAFFEKTERIQKYSIEKTEHNAY